MRATCAVTRGISARFDQAVVAVRPEAPIDVALARRQHAAYVDALRGCGVEITELPPIDELPDSCFVEDCAVVADGVAVVARIGTPSRTGEEASVGVELGRSFSIVRMEAPATLDGGDCMRVGGAIFAGRSARTNAAGVRTLAAAFEPRGVRVIEVAAGPWLHMKCVCSPLDDARVLVAEGTIPRSTFRDLEIIDVPATEAYAANVLAVNDTVLMAAGHPRTRGIVEALGLRVRVLDTSEIRKADGALTCLSIVW